MKTRNQIHIELKDCGFRNSYIVFQAEDGIRGHCVTGVQTCALPIYTRHHLKVTSNASCMRSVLCIT